MGEQFFGQLSDIRKIAPLELEEILQESCISQKDGKLIFTYWVNMEPWEDKPLLVDNNGQFWIGKKSNGYNFVLEEYGRNISEFLGCPSPEVEYYDSNGSSQVVSQPVVEQARREEIPEAKPQTGRGDSLNPRDYAVEKIFNFSNGKK